MFEMTHEYKATSLSIKKSLTESLKLEIGISCINSGHWKQGRRRCCNIQNLWTPPCLFDLLIRHNNVEIAELIFSIWSLCVKSKAIAHSNNFNGLEQVVGISSLYWLVLILSFVSWSTVLLARTKVFDLDAFKDILAHFNTQLEFVAHQHFLLLERDHPWKLLQVEFWNIAKN